MFSHWKTINDQRISWDCSLSNSLEPWCSYNECTYQILISDNILNCDQEGILGTTASVIGSLQANEVLKTILGLKNKYNNSILIVNTLNLKMRIVKFKKLNNCICG